MYCCHNYRVVCYHIFNIPFHPLCCLFSVIIMKSIKHSNMKETQDDKKKGVLKCWECLSNPVQVLYVQCGHTIICHRCLDRRNSCRQCGGSTKVTYPLNGKYYY
ncbi:hypothetical protein B566_EDAN017811 [Ephemera danica]|nr:hypothetical protein B566_EDAN017811 [Ephemera danica]